jgi:hypothetical protein
MNGTDATTGKSLQGIDHLRQSVRDILTTPLGSRVMRRDYGSRLFQLIDAPMNRQTIADVRAAVAEAISRWEPRLQLQQVLISSTEPGLLEIDVSGLYLPNGQQVKLSGIQVR